MFFIFFKNESCKSDWGERKKQMLFAQEFLTEIQMLTTIKRNIYVTMANKVVWLFRKARFYVTLNFFNLSLRLHNAIVVHSLSLTLNSIYYIKTQVMQKNRRFNIC